MILRKELEWVDDQMLEAEDKYFHKIQSLHPAQKNSAINLVHYLALRCLDVRVLQNALHAEGLSSLQSSESHIRSQVLAVLKHFGSSRPPAVMSEKNSRELMQSRSVNLFGNCSEEEIPCIMVSFESSYASDYLMVKRLLESGMNIARINCAHDDQESWEKMIMHVRKASQFTGIPCKIYMDLAGPKIRTMIKGKKGRIMVEEGDDIYLGDMGGWHKDLPVIGTSLPGIAAQLKTGERVLFDDGVIEARVVAVKKKIAHLEIIRVSSKKSLLKNEKGINLPDSSFFLSALTPYDRDCLPFILEHADLIGYSFVRSPKDVEILQKELEGKNIPIIYKIETRQAVENLPAILWQAMKEEYYGVMIARGDLAAEIGFERLSEIQDELLWICEAAHAPVVWATQILESLNKQGIATRAEVTDAAHGIMAECILINKGSHTLKVIEALKDILLRSRGHHAKKRFTFRPLRIASRFIEIGREAMLV